MRIALQRRCNSVAVAAVTELTQREEDADLNKSGLPGPPDQSQEKQVESNQAVKPRLTPVKLQPGRIGSKQV